MSNCTNEFKIVQAVSETKSKTHLLSLSHSQLKAILMDEICFLRSFWPEQACWCLDTSPTSLDSASDPDPHDHSRNRRRSLRTWRHPGRPWRPSCTWRSAEHRDCRCWVSSARSTPWTAGQRPDSSKVRISRDSDTLHTPRTPCSLPCCGPDERRRRRDATTKVSRTDRSSSGARSSSESRGRPATDNQMRGHLMVPVSVTCND